MYQTHVATSIAELLSSARGLCSRLEVLHTITLILPACLLAFSIFPLHASPPQCTHAL